MSPVTFLTLRQSQTSGSWKKYRRNCAWLLDVITAYRGISLDHPNFSRANGKTFGKNPPVRRRFYLMRNGPIPLKVQASPGWAKGENQGVCWKLSLMKCVFKDPNTVYYFQCRDIREILIPISRFSGDLLQVTANFYRSSRGNMVINFGPDITEKCRGVFFVDLVRCMDSINIVFCFLFFAGQSRKLRSGHSNGIEWQDFFGICRWWPKVFRR